MMAKETPAEPVHTSAELIESADVFGVSREIVAGALHGVEAATVKDVEKLIKVFRTKEVKG